MKFEELDIVLLKDGREAVIIALFNPPPAGAEPACILEFKDSYLTDDLPTIPLTDIVKIISRADKKQGIH